MTPSDRWLLAGALSMFLLGCGKGVPTTPSGPSSTAVQKLASTKTPEERFYALNAAAKESIGAGNVEEARKYANELLTAAAKFPGDWNYGNAIQDGNHVLGRIALKEGHLAEAKQYLLSSAASKGSPQMNSFGPNMILAKDLLEKGERETVLEYFSLCRKFWTMGKKSLDEWTQAVKDGQVPNFGPNLLY